jgi:sphingolipid delta-4 desaturase
MRSSVTTATVPPRKPTSRGFTVRAETQEPPLPSESKHEQDFFWTYTEEPHRTRRMAIIKAHPEVGSIPSFSADGAPLTDGCR